MKPCPSCGSIVEVGEESALCSQCGRKHHGRCAGPAAGRDPAAWKCGDCRGQTESTVALGGPAPGAAPVAALNQAHFELLMEQLKILSGGISENNRLIQAQSLQIDSCVAEIQELRRENEALKNRVAQLESLASKTPNEEIYRETLERVDREHNVIINGLPETYNAKKDLETICEVFSQILPEHEIKISSVGRLGGNQSNQNYPRPIRVRLTNPDDPILILRNKSKVDVRKFPKLKIKADLTKRQLQHLNGLYGELEARRSSGETDLVIRYIRRQPVIVKKGTRAHYPKRAREESMSPPRDNGPKIPNIQGTPTNK